MNKRVLIVDDEEDLCELLKENLESMGYLCDFCFSVKQAKAKLERFEFDLVLTDLNMGTEYGMVLVSHVVEKFPETPIIVMSAFGSEDVSVMALKLGAFDFINKPINNENLHQMIQRSQEGRKTCDDAGVSILEELVGDSDPIRLLKSRLSRIARGQAPVFIHGESGVGKEVVANMIHRLSNRSEGPYIPINCGAIPSELIESELFGHKKGSFTGASQDKVGLIQSADGGTLFLDEVAELPLHMQVKLLRVVQEKKIRPVGSDREISVDFRLVSATHRNIDQMVAKNEFRQDLFFRLHVMDVNVPPLRERGYDVIRIATHLLDKTCKDWGVPNRKLTPEVESWLMGQGFPGNVRELHNLVQKAVTMSESEQLRISDFESDNESTSVEVKINISTDRMGDGGSNGIDLAPLLAQGLQNGLLGQLAGLQIAKDVQPESVYIPTEEGLEKYLDDIERKILETVMESVHGNIAVAAKILQIDKRAMRYRVKKHGMSIP